MFCYNVVDDCIVRRNFRKRKLNTNEELAHMVHNITKAENVFYVDQVYEYDDLYKACCALSEFAEDVAHYSWFVSLNDKNIVALAIISVLENNHLWRLLMDETEFYTWVKDRVR